MFWGLFAQSPPRYNRISLILKLRIPLKLIFYSLAADVGGNEGNPGNAGCGPKGNGGA